MKDLVKYLWNGVCDPTLHLIAVALLIVSSSSMFLVGSKSTLTSKAARRCRMCVMYHDPGAPCLATPENLLAQEQAR